MSQGSHVNLKLEVSTSPNCTYVIPLQLVVTMHQTRRCHDGGPRGLSQAMPFQLIETKIGHYSAP